MALGASPGIDSVPAQAQSCSVIVSAGQSIQSAIDQASEEATICLEVGNYEENLSIKKSLTLKGRGKDPKEVRITGHEPDRSVIRIESQTEIAVALENLTVAEVKFTACLVKTSEVICPSGIEVTGRAKTTLSTVQILGNGLGLHVKNSAQANLSDSLLSDNQFGVLLED